MTKLSTFCAAQSTNITVSMITKPIGANYALHYLSYTSSIPELIVNMLNTVLLTKITEVPHIKKLLNEQIAHPDLVKYRAAFSVIDHHNDSCIDLIRTKLVNNEITYKDKIITPLINEELIFNHRGENLDGKIFVNKGFLFTSHTYYAFPIELPRHNEEFQLNDVHFDLDPLIHELQNFTHPLVESLTININEFVSDTYRNNKIYDVHKAINVLITLQDNARAFIRKAVEDDVSPYTYLINDNRTQDCENKVFDLLLAPILAKYYRNNNL